MVPEAFFFFLFWQKGIFSKQQRKTYLYIPLLLGYIMSDCHDNIDTMKHKSRLSKKGL